MDARCCEFLEKEIGVRVVQSVNPAATLHTLPRDATFDVIALWQVFEHLAEPWAFFATAVERLRPGGVLVIATPNPAALQFRIFGRYWVHLDAPRHLQLVPAATLARRGRELGLEQALLTSEDLAVSAHRLFGWQRSLANALGFRTHAGFRGLPRLVRLFARLIAAWERAGQRAVTYTLALRKPIQPGAASAPAG